MPPRRKSAKVMPGLASALAGSPAGPLPVPAAESNIELVKVHLYDAAALKNNLDDVAKQVVLDAGYDEDLMISNVKIALGLLAIAVALYAQLGPGKFPANWWTIVACVVTYCLLTVTLNAYSWLREGDAFLVTLPRRQRGAGLRVTSRMDRFADPYILIFSNDKDPALEARLNTSVTKFYHEDGYLADEAFRTAVEGLLSEYEAVVASKQQKKGQ